MSIMIKYVEIILTNLNKKIIIDTDIELFGG